MSFPSPPVSRPGVTTVNVESGTNEHPSQSSLLRHAPQQQQQPFLQITVSAASNRSKSVTGCRPLLTVVLLLFVFLHCSYWLASSETDLPEDDTCGILQQFLTATTTIAVLCIVYIHTLPYAYLLRKQWCQSALPRIFLIGLFSCAIGVTIVALHLMIILPNDDKLSSVCWNNQPLRDLTLYNIILVLVCMVAVIAQYIFNEESDFSQRMRAQLKLASVRRFIREHWKALLFVLSLFMCYFGYSSSMSYYSALSERYHWSFSDRPANCQTSCNNERWQMNKRRPICLDGNLNKVQLEICLDGLPPREMPSNNHVLFQQCPVLVCRYPNGERVQFYWTLRHEVIFGSDGQAALNLEGTGPLQGVHSCSKHDLRQFSRATLLQEWVCWDDGKHLWVDDAWCHGMQLPYASPDIHEATRLLPFEVKHCINPCTGMRSYAAWSTCGWAVVCIGLLLSFFIQQCGVCHPSDMAHLHSTDVTHPPNYDSDKVHTNPELIVLQRAQLEMARRCRDRFFFTRCRIVLCFVLAYGPQILNEGLYNMLRAGTTLFIFVAAAINSTWLVWLLDATCVHYTWWIVSYSVVMFMAAITLTLKGVQAARSFFPSASQQLTSLSSSNPYSHLRTKSAH